MDVMSYTRHLCLVIILFSQYGSLQNSNDLTQAENYNQEANNNQVQFKSLILTNAEDEPEAEPNDEHRDKPGDEPNDEPEAEPNDEPEDELKDEPTDELNDDPDNELKHEPDHELKDEPDHELKDASDDENDDKSEESSGEFKVYVKSSGEDFVKTPATFNWPTGIVPYVIGKMYDPLVRERIRYAMRIIESSSCVRFKKMRRKPVKGQHFDVTFLSIENRDGVRECSHSSMREKGSWGIKKAILIIGYDCMTRQDIVHALLHALGFRDEVTHPQRDQYIRVMWANIQPKYRKLFWMRTGDPPHKTVEYDSMSIMHFHDRAFSINGGPTVMPLVPGLLISPSKTLSQIDVMKLRLAFGHECNKRKVNNLLQTCQNVLQNDDEEQAHSQDYTSTKVTHLKGPGGPERPADPRNPTNAKYATLFKGPVEPGDPANAEGSTDYEGQLNSPIHLKGPGGPEGPADPKNPRNAKYATLFNGPGHLELKGPADPKDSTYGKYQHLKGPGGPESPADPKNPTNAKYAKLFKGPGGSKGPADPEGSTDSEGSTDPENPTDSENAIDPEGPLKAQETFKTL